MIGFVHVQVTQDELHCSELVILEYVFPKLLLLYYYYCYYYYYYYY